MTSTTRRMRIDDLTDLAVPSRPALSPDGSRVVYVLRTLDAEEDRNVDELWSVATEGGTPRRLTSGPADVAPAWSPDGSRLAFLRQSQVHVLAADGGDPEKVTDLPLGAGAPVWSPDGDRIAFTSAVDPTDPAGSTSPLVTKTVDYQADGAGMFGATRSQLHVVDLASGDCRRLTDGDHAGQPAWSPDGRTLAFTRKVGADSDLTLRTAVHLLDVDDPKAEPRVVAFEEGIAATVSFSADGESLLVVGHPALRLGHAHLLRVPLDGSEPVDVTGHLDRNVMPGGPAYPGARPVETDDGRLLFAIRDRGCSHLWDSDGPVLADAGRVVSGLSVAGSTAVVALATPTSYGEIVALDLGTGAETVLTDHGRSDVELFVPEERTFTISDGTEVQAWLVRDPERQGPLPLLLDVHGGPHNAWNAAADELHFYHQELAARGWAVLLVNSRGSDGYGAAFYDGVQGAWGVADHLDFLEPIDALVAEGLADPDRLAVTGYSYGGFMTGWLTAHDDRFRAAVAGGIVSDLVSEYGASDDGALMGRYELGGPPWERPEEYAAMSPITRVDQVTTPTLVVHGKDDLTCPVGQAQQWHTSLRDRGVPTELVLYPDAPHVFILLGRPSHRLDYGRRVVDWVERYAVHGGRPRIDVGHWERRLAKLAAKHHVPGAQLGIMRTGQGGVEDELVATSYGVLNVRTGTPVTTDALFQIGSITKVWTATVAMALVDEGLLELDTPISEVLPELRLADPDVTKSVTLRHLLTHTSGIDGDVFTDTGRGDDCLEKYVDVLGDAGQNHPLGATWSYCNSGYALLGRVIEKVAGQTWDQAMRERLFTPLGLAHTVTLPEEALLFAAAVGHDEHEGELVPAAAWQLPRSIGPAGLVTSTVADVLAFARMHLTGGLRSRRHPPPERGERRRDGRPPGRPARQVHPRRLVGARLDPVRLGRRPPDRPRRQHPGPGGVPAGASRLRHGRGPGGRAAHQRRPHPRPLRGPLPRDLRPAGRCGDARAVRATVRAGHGRHRAVRRPLRAHVGRHGGARAARTARCSGPRSPARWPSWCRTRSRSTRWSRSARRCSLVKPPEAETWAPVTFYELATGERYVHFGVRATPRVDT